MIPYRNVDGGVLFIEIFLDHIYKFIFLGLAKSVLAMFFQRSICMMCFLFINALYLINIRHNLKHR